MLAPDDKTLEFHLTQPCGYFLKLLSLPVYYPSKEGVATNDNATWATTPETSLCNGPFMLTDYVECQYYTVEKNPDFYNADEVKLETITTKIINDTQAKIAAYESGQIDVATGLPDYIETQYEGSDELTIWNMLTTPVSYTHLLGAARFLGVRSFRPSTAARVASLGLAPSVFQALSFVNNILVNQSLRCYADLELGAGGGDMALSAVSVMQTVEHLAILFIMGMNNAVSTVISYNYGRNNISLLQRIFKICTGFVAISSLIATAVALVLSPYIVAVSYTHLLVARGRDRNLLPLFIALLAAFVVTRE